MNDVAFGLLILFGFCTVLIGFPLILCATITSCIAWSRTRAWKREKAKHFAQLEADVEMDGLMPQEESEEEEPIDSEDEREIAKKKEAQKPDWDLTTSQKFKKEMKRCWKGNAIQEAAEQKEKEERQKIAREVAREMLRAERKREKKMKQNRGKAQEAAEVAGESEFSLPTYDFATSSST